MSGEEMVAIVENLFVGNRLEQGKVRIDAHSLASSSTLWPAERSQQLAKPAMPRSAAMPCPTTAGLLNSLDDIKNGRTAMPACSAANGIWGTLGTVRR